MAHVEYSRPCTGNPHFLFCNESERLLQDRRLRTAHPVLQQCLDARRETIRRCRPASVLFVGVFPHDFDEDAPRSWTKVIRYDMATNRTTRVPDIPRHVGPTLCVAMDDSVFVFGGGPRDDDVFVYRENEWHVAGAMPSRAHFAHLAAFDPREMSASVTGRYIVFCGGDVAGVRRRHGWMGATAADGAPACALHVRRGRESGVCIRRSDASAT